MRAPGFVPNRGGGPVRRRPSHDRATYVLKGTLRFVDRAGTRAALLVEDGNGPGRHFLGHTVTLDLARTRIGAQDRNGDGAISMADLVAGDRVVATLRLPRGLSEPPPLLVVSRLSASSAAVAG